MNSCDTPMTWIEGPISSNMSSHSILSPIGVATSARLSKTANAIIARLCGPKCPSCGHRALEEAHGGWARGWNNLCEQAAGATGRWRRGCEKVQFEEAAGVYYARMRRTTPWVTPRRDPDWVRSVLGDVSHLSSEL